MTVTESNFDERRRDWGRTTLGISADTSQEEACGRFLRMIAGTDFLPDEEVMAAWRAMQSMVPLAVGYQPQSLIVVETERLNEKIAKFASTMFEQEPEKRREAFDRLKDECRLFAIPLAKLEQLRHGLDLRFDALANEHPVTQLLAKRLAEIYVASYPRRAEIRRQILERDATGEATIEWIRAARRIEIKLPAYVHFDWGLVHTLLFKKMIEGDKRRVLEPLIFLSEEDEKKEKEAARSRWNTWIWILLALLFYVFFIAWRSR